MIAVASCSGTLGSQLITVLGFGAVAFLVAALGVTGRRFLRRRLLKLPVDRLFDNPFLMGLVTAAYVVLLLGAIVVVGNVTSPNSCG